MGTEEAKSTSARSSSNNSNNTVENHAAATENISFEEEEIRVDDEDEEIEMSSRGKQRPQSSAPTTNDLRIEEEPNPVVANNQPPVPVATSEANDEIKIQLAPDASLPTKKEDDSLSMKAHQAEESVLDVMDAVGVKVGSFAKEKFGELDKSLNPSHVSAAKDSLEIGALGPMVEELARVFEDTTTMIRKVPYEEQVDLLIGYKKLIEEQIKVIDSRIGMAKRLK
ncbi:MAG TPA: hypothetical protein VFS97_13580 [Nitrososphaeraceae archaeon]|nr:hypothetical protein [Nitrososphaeraceae archaeon]